MNLGEDLMLSEAFFQRLVLFSTVISSREITVFENKYSIKYTTDFNDVVRRHRSVDEEHIIQF